MHNENRSRQTQQSTSNVRNLNVQDTEGVTLAESHGNTIVTTDHGALQIAGDVAIESILAGSDAFRDAGALVRDATDAALDFSDGQASRSFDFAGRALDVVGGVAGDAVLEAYSFARDATGRNFDFTTDTLESSQGFARDIFGDALEVTAGVLREGQAQLGNTVTNLNEIARQNSTSADERIQDIASQSLKIGAAMVGLLSLAFIFQRARA